jgi:hypothetical protein
MSGMSSSRAPESIPTTRKIVFAVLTVVIFFGLIELVLALAGVRPVLVEEDPYVGFSSYIRLFRLTADGIRLETAPNKLSLFNYQSFPASKAAGYRCGSSPSVGRRPTVGPSRTRPRSPVG